MTSVKAETLTVQPPIPQKHLSRFRKKTGIYLIRRNETVLFIGSSNNIYKAVMRHFQKGGSLSHLNRNRLTFEVVQSHLLFRNIETVLKRYYLPKYNKRIKAKGKQSRYEKSHSNRILEAYLHQTRFEVLGEQKTDSNHF